MKEAEWANGRASEWQHAKTNKKAKKMERKKNVYKMLNTHAKTEAKCIFVVLKLYRCYRLDGTANELSMLGNDCKKNFLPIQNSYLWKSPTKFSKSTTVRWRSLWFAKLAHRFVFFLFSYIESLRHFVNKK